MRKPLSVPEAAELAGYHHVTIADACRSGALHGFQRAKNARWKIYEECLEAWVEGRPCEHAAETKAAA